MATLVALDILLALAASSVYMLVARAVGRREVPRNAQMAKTGFVFWWAALAGVTLLGAIAQALAMAQAWTLSSYLAYQELVLLVILLALAGLVTHLMFIFTGRPSGWAPILVGYILFHFAILWYIHAGEPTGLIQGTSGVEVQYTRDLGESWAATALVLALIVPPILASFAYLSLASNAGDRAQRIRIRMVGISIVAWFSVSLAASLGGASEADWYALVSRLIGLLAAMAVLLAYEPRGRLRRWMEP